MSEWIKFTFLAKSDFEKALITMTIDGDETYNEDFVNRMGSVDNRQTKEIWYEITDDMANGTGDHVIRINLHNSHGATSWPIVELTEVDVSGSICTSSDGEINSSISVLNVMDSIIQTRIDAGEYVSDTFVTEDIGDGTKQYTVSSFDQPVVEGDGCWKFNFSCPFTSWFDAVHND